MPDSNRFRGVDFIRVPRTSNAPERNDQGVSHVLGAVLDHIQSEFTALLRRDFTLQTYISHLCGCGLQAVIFGGWARDRAIEIIHRVPMSSRDIDIVTSGDLSEIYPVMGGDFSRNAMGGHEFMAETISVDLWPINETFLIEKNGLPPAFKTLPITADFYCNALVFFPEEIFGWPSLIDGGAINAIQGRIISFCADELPLPDIQVVRVLVASNKLGFSISEGVKDFIADRCSTESGLRTIRNMLNLYCPKAYLSESMKMLMEICG